MYEENNISLTQFITLQKQIIKGDSNTYLFYVIY